MLHWAVRVAGTKTLLEKGGVNEDDRDGRVGEVECLVPARCSAGAADTKHGAIELVEGRE